MQCVVSEYNNIHSDSVRNDMSNSCVDMECRQLPAASEQILLSIYTCINTVSNALYCLKFSSCELSTSDVQLYNFYFSVFKFDFKLRKPFIHNTCSIRWFLFVITG